MFKFTPVERILVFVLVTAILSGGGKHLLVSPAISAPQEKIFSVTYPSSSRPAITVYISGAVKNPGVYTVKEGSRVIDLVERAGGGLPDAKWEGVSLAAVLQEQQQIYLPSKSDPEGLANPPYQPKTKAVSTVTVTKKANETQKVNVNEAGLQELIALPGIGEKTAQRIIQYRKENGPFQNLEDLKKVKGIGEKSYQKFADRITL